MWNNLLLCACFILCGALPCKGNEYRVLEDRSSGYEPKHLRLFYKME
jgi:hypothetical protein